MANAVNTISAAEAGSHPHTERWAAPEVLDGAGVDEKADVYSFAMLLFENLLPCRAQLLPAYHL